MHKASDNGGSEPSPFWRRHLLGLALGVLLVLATLLLFPLRSHIAPFSTPRVGDVATEDVVAPRTLPILRSPAELESLRDSALQSVPLVLRYDQEQVDSVARERREFFAVLEAVGRRERSWDELLQGYPHVTVPSRLQDADAKSRAGAAAALDSSFEAIYRFGLLRNATELPLSENPTAAILRADAETLVRREHLLDVPAAQAVLRRAIAEAVVDSAMRPAFYELARQWLVPNLLLDVRATERRKEMALSAVPENKGLILKDEYIVRAGERITLRHLQGLQALALAQQSAVGEGPLAERFIPMVARFLFLTALFAGLGMALSLVRPGVFGEPRTLFCLATLYVFEIALLYLILFRWDISGYLWPVTVATMLATILLSAGVGLTFGVFLSLVQGVILGFDFAPVFVSVIACTVSCLAVRNVRKRHQFYRPIVVLAVTYAALIALVEYLRLTGMEPLVVRVGYGVLNGVLSPGLAIFSLSILESTFRLTTDITLLELADMNHPLLRRLAVAAPGTYHHSILVANLCEAAAEAVGANPLLARVGAYFHDIGKMEKPEYFVENQMGRRNKHEDLAPSMSALILSAHIKAGADLARAARLPSVIIDFIDQHHGTTQMSYFYRKAREQAGHDIPDADFRYPGPKPRRKETAILMLADSTEAVSRTLDDPRPNRLRSAIHQVITDKFMAGQLSDCPLTLTDLSRIEDAFVHLLLGAFHGRIRYPEQEDALARKREAMLG
jgi:putative nucleotidyltransferase with HDIG domain